VKWQAAIHLRSILTEVSTDRAETLPLQFSLSVLVSSTSAVSLANSGPRVKYGEGRSRRALRYGRHRCLELGLSFCPGNQPLEFQMRDMQGNEAQAGAD
jgi:hypothetical protein